MEVLDHTVDVVGGDLVAVEDVVGVEHDLDAGRGDLPHQLEGVVATFDQVAILQRRLDGYRDAVIGGGTRDLAQGVEAPLPPVGYCLLASLVVPSLSISICGRGRRPK
jgi:hypothetical protein